MSQGGAASTRDVSVASICSLQWRAESPHCIELLSETQLSASIVALAEAAEHVFC